MCWLQLVTAEFFSRIALKPSKIKTVRISKFIWQRVPDCWASVINIKRDNVPVVKVRAHLGVL